MAGMVYQWIAATQESCESADPEDMVEKDSSSSDSDRDKLNDDE
jgi:hypothetical protein